MQVSGIAATTEPVERGDIYVQMTPESLEHAAKTTVGIPINFNHNPMLMPFGRVERAWVERQEDEQASLHFTQYVVTDEPEPFIHEPSQTPCVKMEFDDTVRRFRIRDDRPGEEAGLSVDMSAVESDSQQTLAEAIQAESPNLAVRLHDRQEAIPIPLVQFVMDMTITETLVASIKILMLGTAAEAARRGTLISWAESIAGWLKSEGVPALKTYRQRKTQQAIDMGHEWVVFTFNAQDLDGPQIQLVIPSEHNADIPDDLAIDLPEQIARFGDLLESSDKIVFAYRQEDQSYHFRYALTKEGNVVGSADCYDDGAPTHRQYVASLQSGTTVWWALTTRGNDYAAELFSIAHTPIKHLGWMMIDPSDLPLLKQFGIVPNDGILRPFSQEPTDTN